MSITTTAKIPFEQQIHDAITEAIKVKITEVFDEQIKYAVEQAESKRDETIAKTVMQISKWYNFQNLGETLRIEVTKPKES